MSALFGLIALGLLAYAIAWFIADFRSFSRSMDEREEARERARYAAARRRHASYTGLRVIRGGRDAC